MLFVKEAHIAAQLIAIIRIIAEIASVVPSSHREDVLANGDLVDFGWTWADDWDDQNNR